jgi:hypothetical protein
MKLKYPDIDDINFTDKITKQFIKYKIPKTRGTLAKYCNRKQFNAENPQLFPAQYINPNSPYKGILILHRIGSGKTCTSIQIAERWKTFRKIVVVLPASLKGNYRSELRSLCGGNNYLKASERSKLASLEPSSSEYREIIDTSDKRINKFYNILSYNKFIEHCKNKSIHLHNTLLIIDEIQNMISETGTYYKELKTIIDNSKNLRVVLLSATPMFDKPNEIALTLNLLGIKNALPTGKDFDNTFISKSNKTKNMTKFKKYIKGYISYWRGAPPYTFPRMKIKYMECEMSTFQYNAYKSVLNAEDNISKKSLKEMNVNTLPNNFYIGTRFVSNIVFPNKKTDERGFSSFKGNALTTNLEKYSTKFFKICNNLKKLGKAFIYSSFKELAGLKSLTKVLDSNGYKNYADYGSGYKRYALWSGDEDPKYKDEIKEVFNRIDNLDGNKIKVILGSPSIKEGISLMAVRYVHILEPYWNISRLEQIIGRASRFCAHKDLPEDKRIVRVYIYIATHPNEKETVDQYIKNISNNKNKIIKDFEKAIKEIAIDCHLNINANMYDENDDDIVCDK